MELKTDEQIKKLNTFGVDAKARNFAEIRSIEDLKQAREHIHQQPQDFMVIGGGSNVLFRDDYPGFLLRMMIPGFEKIKEDEEHYFVRAGAEKSGTVSSARCLMPECPVLRTSLTFPAPSGRLRFKISVHTA